MGRVPHFVVAGALVFVSCRPYHMDGAEGRPDTETSTVTQSHFVVVRYIDGLDSGVSREFRLAPGPHTIRVSGYRELRRKIAPNTPGVGQRGAKQSREYVGTCDLLLTTKAGAHYHLQSGPMDRSWGVWADDAPREPSWEAVKERNPPFCKYLERVE